MINEAQHRVPPLDLTPSPQSATSGASSGSHSSMSTVSKKHRLELPSNVSPEPKRRLLTEANTTSTSFRHSAECLQNNKQIDDGRRHRGHPIRNSALGRFFPAGANDISFLSNPFDLYEAAEQHSREGPHDDKVEGGARLDGIHITNGRGGETQPT